MAESDYQMTTFYGNIYTSIHLCILRNKTY